MKLKTSFFNKTLFLKNVTLFWPLWAVYLLGLFAMQTVSLWVSNYNYGISLSKTERTKNLVETLSIDGYLFWIMLFSVLFGMAVFNYLYHAKSANMMHALPVDRRHLYGTNVLSALAFLIVPQVVTAIASVVVSLSFGITRIDYIGIWLLMMAATAFICFSIVVFCAMFTGLLIVLPVYVLIVNFLSQWLYGLICVVVLAYAYGVYGLGIGLGTWVDHLSPYYEILDTVGIYPAYDPVTLTFTGIGVSGVRVLVTYSCVAVVLYLVAFWVYKKRKIESAGDLITENWLKRVFRWGLGITFGIFGGVLTKEFINSIGIACPLLLEVLWILLFGALGYMIAEMLIKKSFHVFQKENYKNCVLFLVALLLIFGGEYALSNLYEDYIPETEQIAYATMQMGYEMEFYEDDIEIVRSIQKRILENKDYYEKYAQSNTGEKIYISMNYMLKDGTLISRGYALPYEEATTEGIRAQVVELEKLEDRFCQHLFGENYDSVRKFNYGYADIGKRSENSGAADTVMYTTIEFSEACCEAMYHAILEDIAEGNLIPYNLYEVYSEYKGYMYLEYDDSQSAYLYFGEDCENMINTLIKYGYIDSADELVW